MSFDREEYEEYLREQAQPRVEERSHELRFFEQAEVAAALLTSDPHWNAFLQILQSEIDYCSQARRGLEEQIANPQHGADEVQRLRMEILKLKTISETLGNVLQLPTLMRERGEKARETLQGYTRN